MSSRYAAHAIRSIALLVATLRDLCVRGKLEADHVKSDELLAFCKYVGAAQTGSKSAMIDKILAKVISDSAQSSPRRRSKSPAFAFCSGFADVRFCRDTSAVFDWPMEFVA